MTAMNPKEPFPLPSVGPAPTATGVHPDASVSVLLLSFVLNYDDPVPVRSLLQP